MRAALLGIVVFATVAGEAAAQPETEARSQIEQAMRRAAEAQAECRMDDWRALHTPDWMITFPTGLTQTASAFLESCTKVAPTVFRDVQVRVFGGDAAVVTAQFQRSRPDGTPGSLSRLTQVWVKQDGQWRNANSHVTTIQNPSAK